MIKWGVLGTGSIANTFIESIKTSKESELFGIASRSDKRAKKFSSLHNCLGFNAYDELLKQEDVNAIYVATTNNSHFSLTFQSLMNNKSVLCEKPLAMNASEVMILMDLARKKNLLLMEAFMYRMHSQTDKIKEIVISEFLNKEVLIDASFGFEASVDKDHRLLNPILGGGSILDVGCYPMSMSRMLIGIINGKSFSDPIDFKVKSELNEENIDLYSQATLTFENNSIAKIASSINKNLENSVKISDGNKSLIIDQPWHCGEYTNKVSEILLIDKNKKSKSFSIETKESIYSNEVNHFAQLLNSSKIESDKISHLDSYGNAVSLDAWRKESGVKYPFDSPENRNSTFFKPIMKINECLIPKERIKGLNKEISRIVFGCDNQLDINHAFAMFDHFYSLGGNAFDTAYIYNNGKSDEYLGRWIKSRKLSENIVILGKGAHTPDCFPDKIRIQLLETLSRLQIECLDIYCLHRDNEEIPVGEFIDALDALKNEGLINIYGASNWSLKRFDKANKYAKSSKKDPFRILSNNFSLARMLDPVWDGCESCSDEDFKNYLENESVPIFPWSSQARGFFLDNEYLSNTHHPANPNKQEQDRVWGDKNNIERRERCYSIAKKKGFEPIEVALAYVLRQKFPTFPLIGPRTFFETESSIKAFKVSLTDAELKWMDLQ